MHVEKHGSEPKSTFPTGLKAPWMDRGETACFDYIFFKGKCSISSVDLMGNKPSATDISIYGSDHMAIVAEIMI